MSKTTLIGIVETCIAGLLAAQALPKEAWEDPRVWVNVILLAILKTARDYATADKKPTI